jgi:hypothetical protein
MILAYTHSEKLKTGLLWANQLVDMQVGQQEEHRSGSVALIRALVSMISSEIQLAGQLAPDEKWDSVAKHASLALVMIDSGVVTEATFHLTKALSHVTTIGQRSMQRLLDQGLL